MVHLRKMLGHDFTIKQKHIFMGDQVNHNGEVLGLVVFFMPVEQLKNVFLAQFWRCFYAFKRIRVLNCER